MVVCEKLYVLLPNWTASLHILILVLYIHSEWLHQESKQSVFMIALKLFNNFIRYFTVVGRVLYHSFIYCSVQYTFDWNSVAKALIFLENNTIAFVHNSFSPMSVPFWILRGLFFPLCLLSLPSVFSPSLL